MLTYEEEIKLQVVPSTSKMDYAETSKQGKRKNFGGDFDLDIANTSASKQRCDPATRDNEEVKITNQVKEILKIVQDKLLAQPSTKFNTFLRDRISAAEIKKQKLVGVFGKTGAGKSSLINAIVGEKDLLPSGHISACTSVIVKLEANMINSKYMASIEFIKKEEWEDQLRSSKQKKAVENSDDSNSDSNSDDDDNCEYNKERFAVYGKDTQNESPEDLIDKKYFKDIPEFLQSENRTKTLSFPTVSELSTELAKYICVDQSNESCPTKYYWPLVKCVTIKLPNIPELLERVTLVDLPGTGDSNKSRDEMWKSIVGSCSSVWIVTDRNRAASEKEAWGILDRTISLMGNGGECRSISFICTKSDCVPDPHNTTTKDGAAYILKQNMAAKKQVKDVFSCKKEIKKHFSNTEDLFQVFTVSSHEFQKENKKGFLDKDETEIPLLQQFLRALNDQQANAVNFVSRAHSILNLIHNSANGEMSGNGASLCEDLEQRLKLEILKINEPMKGIKNKFQECLSVGVLKSKESCLKTMKGVIENKKLGHYMGLRCFVQNDGVYKPKRKKKAVGTEINLNGKLASCMLNQVNDLFKDTFPNQGKRGPIKGSIDQFTLVTESLTNKLKYMPIQLTFLKTEEERLKSELDDDICRQKKEIYASITQSIKTSMTPCYKNAAKHQSKDTLKNMRKDIEEHVNYLKDTMFNKAQTDMLDLIEKLEAHIPETLRSGLSDSIEQVFRNPGILLVDFNEEYQQIKTCMEKLTGVSNGKPSMNPEKPFIPSVALTPEVSLEAKAVSVSRPPLKRKICDQGAQSIPVTAPTVCPSAFVGSHRVKLIQRVTNVTTIADDLLDEGFISNEQYDNIYGSTNSQNAMRMLLRVVFAAGNAAKSAFFEALKKHENKLLQDLLANQ